MGSKDRMSRILKDVPPICGIDLGTTHSSVGILTNGVFGPEIEMLGNSAYARDNVVSIPSVVCFHDHGFDKMERADDDDDDDDDDDQGDAIRVGLEAEGVPSLAGPIETITDAKRLMGLKIGDDDLEKELERLQIEKVSETEWILEQPAPILAAKGVQPLKIIFRDTFPVYQIPRASGPPLEKTPLDVSAEVVKVMKKMAEVRLCRPLDSAVVTVPAYWGDLARRATQLAARKADVPHTFMISEPVAAALDFGIKLDANEFPTFLVFDFGGGTTDVAVMKVETPDETLLRNSASPPPSFLASSTSSPPPTRSSSSSAQTAPHVGQIPKRYLKVLGVDGDRMLGGRDLDERIYETIFVPKFNEKHKCYPDPSRVWQYIGCCEHAKVALNPPVTLPNSVMTDEEKKKKKVRILYIYNGRNQEILMTLEQYNSKCQDLFERAMGPVRRALAKAKRKPEDIDYVLLVGGSSLNLGVQDMLMMKFPSFAGKLRKTDPLTAVARGATLYAAMRQKKIRREQLSGYIDTFNVPFELEDVVPMTLSVKVKAESGQPDLKPVLKSATPLSEGHSVSFKTHKTDQREVKIQIYEGEEAWSSQNTYIGSFTIRDLPPSDDLQTIRVELKCDDERILNVTAQVGDIKKEAEFSLEKEAAKNKFVNLFVLDKSGSIGSAGLEEPIMTGFNRILAELKKVQTQQPQEEHIISLILFGSDVTNPEEFKVKPVAICPELTNSVYSASGLTKLYDAVSAGIDQLDEYLRDSDTVMNYPTVRMFIMTDGEDVSSKLKAEDLKPKIVERLKQGWHIQIIGPQDSQFLTAAANMGIEEKHQLDFTPDQVEAEFLRLQNEIVPVSAHKQ